VTALLVVQAVATLSLTGLVWFVQVVHYPLLARVGEGSLAAYEQEHMRRTTLLVAPLMLAEAVAATGLLLLEPGALTVLGALLLVGIWASSFLVQVPCHRVLADGWNAAAYRRLVRSNWLRTAMWSARSVVALLLLA